MVVFKVTSDSGSLVWAPPPASSPPSAPISPPSSEFLAKVLSSTDALRVGCEVELGTSGAGPCSDPSPHSSWSTAHPPLAAPPSDPAPSPPFSAPSPASRVPRLSEGDSSDPRGDREPSGWGTGFRSTDTSALFSRRPRQTVLLQGLLQGFDAALEVHQKHILPTRDPLSRCAPGQTRAAPQLLLVLDNLGGLTRPHGEREGVHEGLRSPFAPAGAFVVHPELGEVQRPEVGGGGHLEGVGAQRRHHQAPVDVVELGVLFVGVALEDGVEEGHRGGGARERGEAGREEGLLLEGLQQGLQVGARAVGRLPGVRGHHFGRLHRDGARQIGGAGGVPIDGNHHLTEREDTPSENRRTRPRHARPPSSARRLTLSMRPSTLMSTCSSGVCESLSL
ncbi:hypothetical protein EYF80_026583 [Liparis tanakae]|uniref:Uncharacterized protein n=1 Tax=Liparis tanakae TaxID=230148 RepID=A0A4Z2HBC5_9TELE|nr:hypothetical protein EYF80_026583 [Liparis tanakae]